MPSTDFYIDLKAQHEAAPHGSKTALINEAIRVVGSRDKVYEELKKVGWTSGRKPRKDKGNSKVNAEQALTTMAHIEVRNRDNGKQLKSLPEAVADLKANDLLPDDVSVSTVRRQMESYGISPAQMRRPAPYMPQRSKGPQNVHEVDPSVCPIYHFGKNTRFEWMSEREYNDNKPQNLERAAKGRIWRYVLTDHATGYISVFYIWTPGESYINYFDALMYFWGRKEHTPFFGIPDILKSDRIGAMKTTAMQSLLKALNVQHIVAQTPRAKGQVECANNIIECNFESNLRGLDIRDVHELNILANEWERHYNSTEVHSRHGMTRTDCWLKYVREEHLRELPERRICLLLAEPKAFTRTVAGDMTIRFPIKPKTVTRYRLAHIDNINVGDKVKVQASHDYPAVVVSVTDREGNTEKYTVQPIGKDHLGFDDYAPLIGDGHPVVAADTPRETLRKAAKKQAYGLDSLAEADKAKQENKPVFAGQIDPMKRYENSSVVKHLPRKGNPALPAIPTPKHSPTESLTLIRRKLGRPLTPVEGDQIRGQFPDGCTDNDIQQLAQQFEKPALAVVG